LNWTQNLISSIVNFLNNPGYTVFHNNVQNYAIAA